MSKQQASFETFVAGIPCGVVVTHYLRQPGSFSYNAASDVDYYGYTECDWELVDRHGYRAAWLERKMKDADKSRIESEIERHYEELRRADDY